MFTFGPTCKLINIYLELYQWIHKGGGKNSNELNFIKKRLSLGQRQFTNVTFTIKTKTEIILKR